MFRKTATFYDRIAEVLDLFGAALDASASVRLHRKPEAETLRRLGIEEKDFPSQF